MPIIRAIPTSQARAFQAGETDANGQVPRRAISTGTGNPCRHCLNDVPENAAMLILAYRPFDSLHPYAETGPIFLCADPCERHADGSDLPPVLTTSPDYMIKGYNTADSIVYGTGAVVEKELIHSRIAEIFADPVVAYIHIRSARNNCYQARVDRE
jgi:hypothetical protein